MKKIIALLLALMLSLAVPGAMAEALPAQEARYTHPTQGYSFIVPDGWLMVDETNIDAYIAAYEKGEMAFTGVNAQALQQMKAQIVQNNCGALTDPYGNNAIFVSDSIGTLQTNEQFILLFLPILKQQLQQQMPSIEFTSDGEILTFGENQFISLAATYQMSGLPLSLDQLYMLDGTRVHCISLTVSTVFGQAVADQFYAEISNVLASFTLAK